MLVLLFIKYFYPVAAVLADSLGIQDTGPLMKHPYAWVWLAGIAVTMLLLVVVAVGLGSVLTALALRALGYGWQQIKQILIDGQYPSRWVRRKQ